MTKEQISQKLEKLGASVIQSWADEERFDEEWVTEAALELGLLSEGDGDDEPFLPMDVGSHVAKFFGGQ